MTDIERLAEQIMLSLDDTLVTDKAGPFTTGNVADGLFAIAAALNRVSESLCAIPLTIKNLADGAPVSAVADALTDAPIGPKPEDD